MIKPSIYVCDWKNILSYYNSIEDKYNLIQGDEEKPVLIDGIKGVIYHSPPLYIPRVLDFIRDSADKSLPIVVQSRRISELRELLDIGNVNMESVFLIKSYPELFARVHDIFS